jgi:hypothetical protein
MSSAIDSSLPVARPRRSTVLTGAAAAAIVTLAVPVHAAPSASDKAVAEALFRDGKRLIDSGTLQQGCAKLEESERLDPKLGTLLNVATCHEKLGRTASAWAEFNEAASLATASNQSARETFARSHASALEQQLSSLVLTLTAPPRGLAIELGDKHLGAAALSSSIPVDPGELSLRVTAPGKKAWTTQVTIAKGPASREIVIPPLVTESREPSDGHVALPPPSTPRGAGQRIAGVVLASAGLIGIGIGATFGLRAIQQSADYRAHLDLAHYKVTQQSAIVSTIAFSVGLASTGGGAALFFTAPTDNPRRIAFTLTPTPLPGGAFVSLGGPLP